VLSAVPVGAALMVISRMRDREDEEDKDKSNAEIYLKTMEGLSSIERVNYMHIPIGKRDEDGNYISIRIAKEHTMTPFLAYSDWITQNFIRKTHGIEEESDAMMIERIKFALGNNLTPVKISKAPVDIITASPTARAILTWETGYDFFREQPLVQQSYRNISLNTEGLSNRRIEEFYKEMGKRYDISPARTKAAVESFITSPQTNPLAGVLYTGAATVYEDDKILSEFHKDLTENIMKSPLRRMKTTSSEFVRGAEGRKIEKKALEKEYEKAERHRVKENDLIYSLQREEIDFDEFMKESAKLNPEDPKKLADKYTDLMKRRNIDRNIVDLKYAQSTRIRAVLTYKRYGNLLDGSPESIEVIRAMRNLGGIWTDDFKKEYIKILQGEFEQN